MKVFLGKMTNKIDGNSEGVHIAVIHLLQYNIANLYGTGQTLKMDTMVGKLL